MIRKICLAFVVLAATMMVVEFLYRFQVVDFYGIELQVLNNPDDLQKDVTKKTILIGGDSFTADHESYVALLREKLPQYKFINAAVPGTGIMQASIILPKRIKEFEPDIFIYQVYVGNDLLDIRHPLDWKRLSFFRNVYWWLSDKFHVVSYLNYKAGFLKPILERNPPNSKNHQLFSLEKYSEREKLYFKTEPELIENSVLLAHDRENDMEVLLEKLKGIQRGLGTEAMCYILVIPNCAQINETYMERMKLAGAILSNSEIMMETNYPFIRALENNFNHMEKVKVLNPLEVLRKTDLNDTSVFYANDPHLTPEGQSIIADFLMSQLFED